MTRPAIELNLPDLPEVPIRLGPMTHGRVPLRLRARDALTSYLPLLLMVLLALGTWWLVKNSPAPLAPQAQQAPRADPDYTMNGFKVQRFAPDGALKVVVEGRQLRHFPDVDRVEIDSVTIHAYAPGGRETVATAQRALANGDVTEVQLLRGAQVRSRAPDGQALAMDSEFLHLFVDTERVRTHLPVRVQVGTSEMAAAGLDYDHLARMLELKGPMRAVFAPPGAKGRP